MGKHATSAVRLFLLTIVSFVLSNQQEARDINSRTKRLFNFVQIIRFSNDPCGASNSRMGTCYTAEECEKKGGTNGGACAQSFGVCCVFQVGCGETSRENCTYFASSSQSVGSCKAKICPCGSNICQLRLDFRAFAISGPSAATDSAVMILNGVVANAGKAATLSTRCLVDTFQVTNPGGLAPPVICGMNDGAHVYVDASPSCNDLAFQIGPGSTGSNWDIKVTQYSCDFNNLAPPGCTQYFSGNGGAGMVKTFNFDGGQHLANQDQAICVRNERAFCRICWFAVNAGDVQTSTLPTPGNMGVAAPNNCCRYGNSGGKSLGYDCIIIPGAATMKSNADRRSRMCGNVGLVTASISASKTATICSCQQPFLVRFMSDNYEFVPEAKQKNVGVSLMYFEDANCASSAATTG